MTVVRHDASRVRNAMNVADVRSSGGLDRGAERTVELPRVTSQSAGSGKSDSATISDASHTLHSVERLTESLRANDPERRALVDRARQRLESGALDQPEVFHATAEALLRGEQPRA